MRNPRLWRRLLGVDDATVIISVGLHTDEEGEEIVLARVRPRRNRGLRCSQCHRRCPRFDSGGGTRRWRALDLGTIRAYLQADAPRVSCPEHKVVVAAVPWARPAARFTSGFEDTCAWLAAQASGSAVATFLRVTWRSVVGIVTRVVADLAGRTDTLGGLRRVGVDEIAYRKGHRYLLVVVDHDTGRLVWAREGRNKETLRAFFDDLGADRATLLTEVSADGAEWIHTVVAERAPNATVCLDPFHVVAWGTKALDELRRTMVNQLKATGRTDEAKTLKDSRWALVKNPLDLTGDQRTTLASIKDTNAGLYRGYLLKEQLRMVFVVKGAHGRALLAGWISWARRSQLKPFVDLAKTITKYQKLIWNTLDHELSNARSEATNTHLRVLTRRAYGFHSPEALIAMAMLTRGGLCPPLPGRAA